MREYRVSWIVIYTSWSATTFPRTTKGTEGSQHPTSCHEKKGRKELTTSGVRVACGILSEIVRRLLGLWLLRLRNLRDLRICVYYTRLRRVRVIAILSRCGLGWYHCCLLGRGVWRRHGSTRICSETCRSKVWMLERFCCCDAFCGIELKKAFE